MPDTPQPTIIGQYDAQTKHADDFSHTRMMSVFKGYLKAAEKHLGYNPGVEGSYGLIDRSLLEDDRIRAQVVDEVWDSAENMIWSYVTNGAETGHDELAKNRLLLANGGLSREKIATYIDEQTSDFDPVQFTLGYLDRRDKEWVDAANVGYAAARGLIDINQHKEEIANAVKLDEGSIDYTKLGSVDDLVALLEARKAAKDSPIASKQFRKKNWFVGPIAEA